MGSTVVWSAGKAGQSGRHVLVAWQPPLTRLKVGTAANYARRGGSPVSALLNVQGRNRGVTGPGGLHP